VLHYCFEVMDLLRGKVSGRRRWKNANLRRMEKAPPNSPAKLSDIDLDWLSLVSSLTNSHILSLGPFGKSIWPVIILIKIPSPCSFN